MKVKLKDDYKRGVNYMTQEPLDYLEEGVEYTLKERRICSSYSYYCLEGIEHENGLLARFPAFAFDGGREWYEKKNKIHYEKLRESMEGNFKLSWYEEESLIDGVREYVNIYKES